MEARNYNNLHIFIHRLLRDIDPKMNMTGECKDILNSLIKNLAKEYVQNAIILCRHAKKITIDSNTITTLNKIWIDDLDLEEFTHIVWDRYSENVEKGLKKDRKAGLNLQPSRIQEILKEYRGGDQKIGDTAVIFLTATLEFILRNLLVGAIQGAKRENKITVSGAYVYSALTEFKYRSVFKDYFIAGYGYAP